MGNLCRVPSERAVLGKEVVAERESAPRDLRVARGFRRRPRVAFPRAGAERRPMLSSRRRFARWAARRVRGAQERGRLSVLWTLVLARRAKMLVLAPRARRRVSRCSIALQLCASRGSVFGTGVRFVDASARRDSETMIYITCALATSSSACCTRAALGRAVSLGHHAGKRRVLASTCKLLAECYSCKRSDSHTNQTRRVVCGSCTLL